MLSRLTPLFGAVMAAVTGTSGAKAPRGAQLQPTPPPRTKGKFTAYPSYLSSTSTSSDTSLSMTDRRLASTDITRINRSQGTRAFLRDFAHSSPDISAAMFSYLRVAITNGYTAVARNPDGTFNADGTQLIQQLLVRFDILPALYEGFAGMGSMRSNSESLGKEIFLYGACSLELVLGNDRLPLRLQPISTTGIEFKPKGDVLKPIQKVGGVEISLDIPTFFYTALDMELLSAYASSPIESAIKPALFSEEFQADLARVVKRAIHPRVRVTIDEAAFRKNAPPAASNDEEAMLAYMTQTVADIEEKINNLRPEDAIVHWDSINISMDNNGNISLSKEYETLQALANSKLATGVKAPPAILGHGAGSSNIASTETLLFAKNVAGAIQYKLNEIYSRALTLAARLHGLDVYVRFDYAPIDLRPESELEAFKALKQSRFLEMLSIGMISDEVAALELTGTLPPAGAPKLSGTFFKSKSGASEGGPAEPSNSGSTLNQNLNPDTPTAVKGQNKKADPQKE